MNYNVEYKSEKAFLDQRFPNCGSRISRPKELSFEIFIYIFLWYKKIKCTYKLFLCIWYEYDILSMHTSINSNEYDTAHFSCNIVTR